MAFDWAPRNTVSHLLSRVNSWIRTQLPEVRALLTFLNPNLGFSGTAFKASGWKPYLELEPMSAYFDDNYVSYRDLQSLSLDQKKRAKQSVHNLMPLKLLRYDLIGRGETLEQRDFAVV
jgi:hypothetical protein